MYNMKLSEEEAFLIFSLRKNRRLTWGQSGGGCPYQQWKETPEKLYSLRPISFKNINH